jgi:hypothetical protein
MTPSILFQRLWDDYTRRLCPSAQKVHDVLQEDEPLINDHIALRTFSLAPLGIQVLAAPFIQLGYQERGDYRFDSKKLTAKHFEHPDPNQPKVFISQLDVDLCSDELQVIVTRLMEQIAADELTGYDFLFGGRLWEVSHQDYMTLSEESEYAAWLAAHGFGANHFTVSVNQLRRFNTVKGVNDHLRQSGFVINDSGGEVKGSPDVLLEQSSTIADSVLVPFSDGEYRIPGGFYEFALRYLMPDGQFYQGFVAASADKIFESTDQSRT